MTCYRRQILQLAFVPLALAMAPRSGFAEEESDQEPAERLRRQIAAERGIAEFCQGRAVEDSVLIRLEIPQHVESGATVPLSFAIDLAWSREDFCPEIVLFARGNPVPRLLHMSLSPESGAGALATRIRLAGSQTLTLLARHSSGRILGRSAVISVLEGGC